MDTNVLKTFVAVCEYSGFSAAADKLGYTQSTVSSQIKQLENELDTVLLSQNKPYRGRADRFAARKKYTRISRKNA